MIVFRVQNNHGEGMYRGAIHTRSAGQDELRRPALPDGVHSSYYFGFPSLRHLIEWVADEPWLWRLVDDGFRIAVYHSHDYTVHPTQCVFRRDRATLLYHLRLEDLLPHVREEQPVAR